MKKSLLLGIVGLAVTVASSFGQGGVNFATYNSGTFIGAPITYSSVVGTVPTGKEGLALGSSFSAELFYLNGSTWTALPGTTAAFYGSADGDLATGAGYFYFGPTTVPLPIGDVQLMVYAFNNVAIGSYGVGEINGYSAAFHITTVDPQTPTYPDFSGTTYQPFTVSGAAPVPEPSTFALAGLGLAGLLIFRRRK